MTAINQNVGMRFPFRFADGRVERSGGVADQEPTERELDDAMQGGARQIVLTGKGERPMLGQFGVGADRYLFHPLQVMGNAMLARDVKEQFDWWGRSDIAGVSTKVDVLDGVMYLELQLRYKDNRENSTLKFSVRGISDV